MAKGFSEAKVAAFKHDIVQWLSQGKTLAEYCRQPGTPEYSTVYKWMYADEEFDQEIARARETGYDVIADDCVAIIDEMPERDEKGRVDPGYVAWQKNRVWARTQLLSKWSSRYSDKKSVDHSGGVNINLLDEFPGCID